MVREKTLREVMLMVTPVLTEHDIAEHEQQVRADIAALVAFLLESLINPYTPGLLVSSIKFNNGDFTSMSLIRTLKGN